MMKKGLAVVTLLFLLIAAGPAHFPEAAQTDPREAARAGAKETEQTPSPSSAAQETKGENKGLPSDNVSISHHSINVNGDVLRYTATAGYIPLKDKSGKLKGNTFFIAYVKDGVEDLRERPLTFAFNGGPGASSIWLHLGALGPKRVPVSDADETLPSPPPHRLVDNEQTWLTFTDLVFIDPIGTGYSRAAPGEDPKQFYGVDKDAQAVGEFIRLYTTQTGRWRSPRFLTGESYGTYRAVRLANHLYQSCGMTFNGLVLISTALNFQTFTFHPGNDLSYITFLPSFAATALYHGKLSPEFRGNLPGLLRDAEHWAQHTYNQALIKGDSLPPDEREEAVRGLMRYTGLSQAYIESRNLRITNSDFLEELLRCDNATLDLMDGRFTTTESPGDFIDYPSMVRTIGSYMNVWNDYARNDLKFETDLTYEFLSNEVNRSWEWGSAIRGYVNVTGTLREAVSKMKFLRVLIANGYYDLNTPYFAGIYTVNHLGLHPSLRSNIRFAHYESGHQMYVHEPSLNKLTEDAKAFILDTY